MFYKLDGDLIEANEVTSRDYELITAEHEGYEYPTDGWSWFDTRQEALDFFGIKEEE